MDVIHSETTKKNIETTLLLMTTKSPRQGAVLVLNNKFQ